FRPEQIQGLTEWVLQGGRIVIILGGHGLPSNALTEQWPLRVGALRENLVTSGWLTRWGLSEAKETMAVAHAISDSRGGKDALFAVDHMGFGRVGVLGLDPRTLGEHQRAHSTAFWMHLLDQMLQDAGGDTLGTGSRRIVNRALTAVVGHAATQGSRHLQRVPEPQDRDTSNQDFHSYAQGTDQQSTGRILDYLYAIDEMRPLSIGWVVLLLVLLAVLLGPVDYLVLKRLDKQPLTWVTSLGWILLFTVGAYYGVQALRAGDMQFRTVSLTDAVQGQEYAWNTRVCGLFAPRSDEYQFDRLAPGQWWSGAAASGSRWNSYQARSARRTLYCRQNNGSNWPHIVPINIWTMQTLTVESRQGTVPIQAQVTVQDDGVTVEVTNQGAGTISEGMVVLASGRGIRVGRVGPGETRAFEGTPKPMRAWQHISNTVTGGRRPSLDPADIFTMAGVQGRSQGIRDHLNRGAAVVCVRFEDEPSPFTVKNKGACQYDHVQFARLVVFPQ
ncbi:MAG: hypothetical protein GY809_28375, partial [Planctomycetes bacterium]|nr:hypothetical protein [Planctomycetota bacterium]